MMSQTTFAVLLDLDGTLVDSVYHHVLAWDGAFKAAGYDVPLRRIHLGIGMGGDRLVPWVLGGHPDDLQRLKDDHTQRFLELATDLHATDGAHELLDDLNRRDITHRVATSADPEVHPRLTEALGVQVPAVGAGDVAAPKPAPDLLLSTCEEMGVAPERAILVGDSPWDAQAARRIGMGCVAVRTGGFSDEVLREAGADEIADDPRRLVARL